MHIRNRDCREIQREREREFVCVIVDMIIIYYDTCLKNWMEIYMRQPYLNLWGMTVSKKEDVIYIIQSIMIGIFMMYFFDCLMHNVQKLLKYVNKTKFVLPMLK